METKGREQSSNVIDRRPKTISDIIDQESFPNKTQSSQFLIDTFKRARETGYSLPPEIFSIGSGTYITQGNDPVTPSEWIDTKLSRGVYTDGTEEIGVDLPFTKIGMKYPDNQNKRFRVVK